MFVMETLQLILIGVIVFLLLIIIFLGSRVLVINNDSGCKCGEGCKCREQYEMDSVHNIQNEKNQGNLVLRLFYADWCGHCQHMKADWQAAKTMLKAKVPQLAIEEIEHSNLDKNKYPEIKGYPTIILFKGNDKIEYKGDRSTNSIVDFVMKNM